MELANQPKQHLIELRTVELATVILQDNCHG